MVIVSIEALTWLTTELLAPAMVDVDIVDDTAEIYVISVSWNSDSFWVVNEFCKRLSLATLMSLAMQLPHSAFI